MKINGCVCKMGENEAKARKFLDWIGNNYDDLIKHFTAYYANQRKKFDIDIFSDTYLKLYEHICKNGIRDDSEKGMMDYLFMAVRNNTIRESQYIRNKNRSEVGEEDSVERLFDEWYNNTNDSADVKIANDLYKDYASLYLARKVEKEFDEIHFFLWRIKHFSKKMTYKQLGETTGIKNARTYVNEVNAYLKENVTKQEIKEAFLKWLESEGNEKIN